MDLQELLERERQVFTLAFIMDGDKILLGLKKRGFGTGIWNGFGGKLEENEDISAAAVREIEEECGLRVNLEDLTQLGVNYFKFPEYNRLFEVHIFKCEQFQGVLQESEEMRPEWYSLDSLPWDKMWLDDGIWYPLLLNGEKFRGFYHYDNISKSRLTKYIIVDLNDNSSVIKEENFTKEE